MRKVGDFEYQKYPYYCGPAAVRNGLYALQGKAPKQERIARLAGTSKTKGTQEEGIITCINKLAATSEFTADCDEVTIKDPDGAFLWLMGAMVEGCPTIICTEQWEHWVTAIGALNSFILIFDPANKIGGIKIMDKASILNYWNNDRGGYFGISLKNL
jgi:hypothetical protein